MLKEDTSMINLFASQSRAHSELGNVASLKLKKTFGKLDVKNFPINTSTWCIFARECMWASFQMGRIVETSTRGCENVFFTNTQDSLGRS